MNTLQPQKISRPKPYLINAIWADGYDSTISCESLRKACPCATCTGESIGDVIYSRPKPVLFEPGVYDLVKIEVIGNYAIRVYWKNGHDTGIYTWDKLKQIFEKYKLSQEEIDNLDKKANSDKRNISFNVIK